MGKLYGVGVNDFDEFVKVGGIFTYEYTLWTNMLMRCYSKACQRRQPSYVGCTVSEELLSFKTFSSTIRGMVGFKSVDEKGRNFQLDKDLLSNKGKQYSKETLCFVPREINMFLTDRAKSRGDYLVGVSKIKLSGKFQASISIDGKVVNLGVKDTEWEAFQLYKKAKKKRAEELAEKWYGKVDRRVYDALVNYEVSSEG